LNARSMLPLIDLGFLTLGAVVALLAESSPRKIEMIPVDLASASAGSSQLLDVREPVVVTVTPGAILVGDQPSSLDSLVASINGRDVILQPDRGSDAQDLIVVMSTLTAAGIDVRLAVKPSPATQGGVSR